ncbi:hypothetical protein LR066_01550 [candidate division WOR-3 bacterium]|nr:hypothetical protein [candidate division WOR-3 bacterium]
MNKIALIFSLFFSVSSLFSDTPESLIRGTASEILATYTKPLVTAFGTAMGTDFIPIRDHKPLGFSVGAKLVWVSVPEKAKTATYTIDIGDIGDTVWIDTIPFTETTTFEANTIFGGREAIEGDPIDLIGLGFPGIFFAVPQLNLGLFKRLNMSIRWCPFNFVETKGHFFGASIKYTTRDLIPMPIFSLTLIGGGGYQGLRFGDIARADNLNGTVMANLGIAPPLLPVSFSPYVGIGLERTNFNFSYKEIEKTVIGDNLFRGIVGVGIDYLLFDIDISYNIGKMNSFGLGIGIGVR